MNGTLVALRMYGAIDLDSTTEDERPSLWARLSQWLFDSDVPHMLDDYRKLSGTSRLRRWKNWF